MKLTFLRWDRRIVYSLFTLAVLALTAACNRGGSVSSTAAPSSSTSFSTVKRYGFKGKVMAIDKSAQTADIDNEPITGFMDAMVMPYSFKPAAQLDSLKPGDIIAADVVVDSDKYWLENVKVTGHSDVAADKPTASLRIPAPGDEVPDFKLVNQDGRNISLQQYRGQTLLLTLIYTRCPFPNFCPRVSHEFAAIDRQMLADPERYGKAHLLSISFDPANDTPKVLRAYGFSCSGGKDASLFKRWEFAAIREKDLARVADYFALTYKAEGGLITHSLSTAVISPDGKIFKWYKGADWQASELLRDLAAASRPAA